VIFFLALVFLTSCGVKTPPTALFPGFDSPAQQELNRRAAEKTPVPSSTPVQTPVLSSPTPEAKP
jgi:hypothetical protein